LSNKKKIAVVGMACRFPGEANSPTAYWELLKNAKDAVSEVSSDRWDNDFYQHADKKAAGKSYTFSAGVLTNIDQFDAEFFGISPREAAQMDPQQRLLLELTWEALEDAGQIPAELSGKNCAVVVGIASTDYVHRRVDDLSSIDPYSMTGNTASIASNRLSYILNVTGPSFSVDTACSSSLVAINQACHAIWSGEASTAIAAGVNLLLHPFAFIGFSKASMLSPQKEGRCRAFDDSGDGYVRAEGCAVLYLKPLDQAEADGDNIHAVILGSGINSNGKTNGITLPSSAGQAALLQHVYTQAGVTPDELDYLEAHGTGTAVGDPLEAAAIAKALSSARNQPLPIGSAKTNVGHLETASGMAGIFKVILSLKHRAIPASLHFKTPNKNIDFKAQNIRVVKQFTSLKEQKNTLKMGINSFGFGGANAHIVLEEYKPNQTNHQTNSITNTPPLFLSAHNHKALQAIAGQYRDLIQHALPKSISYSNIANSAYYHRQQLNFGLCVHGKTSNDIVKQLDGFANEKTRTQTVSNKKLTPQPRLALVFSGNGSQWQGMGCELLKTEPIFKQTVEHIAALLSHYETNGDTLLLDAFNALPEDSQLDDTEIAQPLLFALQVGLVNVLQAQGIHPEAVIGHSVGEVAAAWACGALSLEQAVQVIYQRSHAQGETKGMGRMAAIAMGHEAFNTLLQELQLDNTGNPIEISGINSPNSITVSADLTTLEHLSNELRTRSIRHKILDLDYAFHSHYMDAIQQRVLNHLHDITPNTAQILFASTVTGKIEKGKQLDNHYWWDNVRQPVRFGAAINHLLDEGFTCFIEVGPHPIMRGYINESLRARDITGMVIPTIQKEQESLERIKSAAYSTYLAGCRFNASGLLGEKTSYTPLPSYPWQRERHWYPLTSEGYDLVSRKREHPLLGYRLKDAEAQWENIIDTTLFPYLTDHVVDGGVILPAAAYIEIALAAAKSWFNQASNPSYEIENIDIHAPIVLDHTKVVRFNLLPDDGTFKISSRDRLSEDPWTLNVVGRLMGSTARKPAATVDINNIKATSQHSIARTDHYQLTAAVGLDYGVGFQGIEHVWVNTDTQQATAQLRIDDSIRIDFEQYILHPSLLDAGFQLLVDVFSSAIDTDKQAALIPVQVGKLYHYQSTHALSYLHVQIKKQSPQSVVADFILYNPQGECLAELHDCRFRAMQLKRSQHTIPSSYTFQAQLMPLYATPETAPKISIEAIKKAVVTHFSTQNNTARQHHYEDILPLLDAASSMFAWQALKQFKRCHTAFTIDQLCKQEQIDRAYLPLLQRMLSILEQDELASQNTEGQWILATSTDLPNAEAIWLAILGDSSAYIAELIMLGRCGMHLGEVLQGTLQADELLFPTKSSIKSHWHTASPSYITINSALGASIHHIVNHWPDNKRIRILQIGDGDTSLTQQLLPLLPAEKTDYLFSDKNSDVLSSVNFELADYTFLTTIVLDIEASLTEQLINQTTLAYHSYDIIIAVNTLHQCHHLDNALQNIKQLLAPKGLLLLLENQPDRFTDLTFGIDPAWWVHSSHTMNNDKEHTVSSLLTTTEWQQHLEDIRFENIAILQEPAAIEGVGTFIIIAESPILTLNNQQQSTPVVSQPPPKPLSWLIFHDNNTLELAYALQLALQEKQHDVNLTETLSSQTTPVDNIIHLAGLNDTDRTTASTILALQEKRCLSTIKLAQQLEKNQTECTLWLITRNAAVIDPTKNSFSFNNTPEQAALWGLGRVLMNEHPTLQSFLIDLQDQKGQTDTIKQSRPLIAEFLNANPKENEIILSENARHVMRMRKKNLLPTISQPTASKPHFSLEFKTPGPLKNLYWKALPARRLKANEIEIHPLATGLNFRDVMYTMGLLSDEAVENGFAGPTLGMELAGTVMQVGDEVDDFNIGDAVIGFAPACFSSRVITETTAVAHKPASWNYQEAATVPTTFFTVYYALHHLAHLEEGDKILIHGAAGGVGIAAIQYARYCGAEIFATAGSDEKRDFVRLMGANHILDSRSLNYADDIMAITKGEGIDIVLNSLAGEAINRNLAILKPFGRFLELGKRDFYENSKIGLRPFRNNISYFGIDADQLLIQRPALASRLFKEMMGLFNKGILRPLPYRTFPATHIEDAFRYMQQSKQIGKVIVSFEDQAIINTLNIETEAPVQEALQCDANSSYLVTGGLSGFGLKTAQWLVEKGAQHLILISRGGTANNEVTEHITTLREQGISIATHACDVTDEDALRQLISQIPSEKPLKGIIHAAMVLDDGLIRNMKTAQFNSVIAPKISGAWHLHTLTKHLSLDFFVLYSSATTFMGNPGQANYVAANLFLESLAHYRHAKQLPATYAAWGAIDDVGFLARNEKTKAALQSRLGGKPLHSDQALAMLEKLIVNQHIGAAIIDFDWSTIQRLMPSARSNKYKEQLRQCSSASEQTEDIQTLIAGKNTEDIQALISTMLMGEIAQILRISTEKLDITSSIFDLGMDSLMGMELVLAIEERFNVKLPVMALTEGANIKRIAERISEQLISNETEKDHKTDNVNLIASQHGQALSEEDAKKLSAAVVNNNTP